MKATCTQRKSFVISTVILVSTFTFSSVFAEGPVAISSLPGGGNFTDQGDGTGESWGRSAGVNWSFNNFDLSRFDSLTWGPIDNLSVGIALDGTINGGSEEYLSLSSVTQNQAIWVGATQIDIFSGNTITTRPVDTRFVLTVSSGGGLLPLETNTTDNLPAVNVITANGQFVANLKMQAKFGGTTTWEGALDFFDRLSTTGDGLAKTSFSSGFFFDLVGGGGGDLSLSAHDTNMVNQTNQIIGDLDFLTIESVNRLTDLGARSETLENLLRGLSHNELADLLNRAGTLEQLVRNLTDLHNGTGTSGPDADEIRQIVSDSRQELTDIITFLWGLSPGGEGFPDPADIPQISDLSTQQSLDALATLVADLLADQSLQLTTQTAALSELKQTLLNLQSQMDEIQAVNTLSLEVIGSKRDSKNIRRLLVLVKENSAPIKASRFIINGITDSRSQGFNPFNVTHSDRNIGDGLYELNLDLRRSANSTRLFQIIVEHDHDNGTSHRGTTIFASSTDDDDD